ncbi:hypothetical protein FF2_037114 [Malus domestica]
MHNANSEGVEEEFLISKHTLEKQINNDSRSQPLNEEMDLVYEDKPSSQIFEDLEKKFLDDIRNLAKEQSDAEDVENARHRELDNFGIVFGWTQWSGKIQNLMDNEVLCKDVSGEQARESLIVISDPVADQVLDLSFLPALLDRVAAANRDGHEKYVSELMSISNLQSPNIKTRLFAM